MDFGIRRGEDGVSPLLSFNWLPSGMRLFVIPGDWPLQPAKQSTGGVFTHCGSAPFHGVRRFPGQTARWRALPCEESRRQRADLFVPPAACSGVVNEAFGVSRFWRHARCILQAAGLVVFSAASLTARLLLPSRSDATNGLAFTHSAPARRSSSGRFMAKAHRGSC